MRDPCWLVGGVARAQRQRRCAWSVLAGGAEDPWVLEVLSWRTRCSGDPGDSWVEVVVFRAGSVT